MATATIASDDQVEVLADHVRRQSDAQLNGIQAVLDVDDPGWFAAAHVDPAGHADDIDLKLATALANAEVAKAMAAAGLAPDGTIEAKLKALDAYRRAVVDAGVLPQQIARKAAEEHVLVEKAGLEQAKTRGEIERLRVTQAQVFDKAKHEAESDRMLAAAEEIKASMTHDATQLQAVIARIGSQGQVDDALIDEERKTVGREGYRGRTGILRDTQQMKLSAEAIREARKARRELFRAKAPDYLVPAALLLLLLVLVTGVTVVVQQVS